VSRKWKRRTVQTLFGGCLIAIMAAELPVGRVFSQDQPRVSILPRKAPPAAETARSDIRADVNMVLIPVSISDRWDHPITNLTSNAFRLFEDQIEQTIQSFSYEEGPVSIGFIFDASSSMRNKLGPSVVAIRQFLLDSVPSDEFCLVAVSDRPTLVTRFVTDPEDILKKLSSLHPDGFTALNDAIVMGIHQMKSAKNVRRALVVLTDGYDNNSRATPSELRNVVLESDVRLYAISVVERSYLDKLAALTGGQTVWAHDLTELPDVVERLSRELRHQYVIGYSPKNQRNDGKYRSVRVELEPSLRQQELNVSWRHGYRAPQ